MILQALHTKMNVVLVSYPLIADITQASTPFAVYSAQPQPQRDKDGLSDYIYTVNVKIIDDNTEVVNTYTASMLAAILAMAGQTINSTEITAVLNTDESGVYYSDADAVYMNDLEFKFFTKNR